MLTLLIEHWCCYCCSCTHHEGACHTHFRLPGETQFNLYNEMKCNVLNTYLQILKTCLGILAKSLCQRVIINVKINRVEKEGGIRLFLLQSLLPLRRGWGRCNRTSVCKKNFSMNHLFWCLGWTMRPFVGPVTVLCLPARRVCLLCCALTCRGGRAVAGVLHPPLLFCHCSDLHRTARVSALLVHVAISARSYRACYRMRVHVEVDLLDTSVNILKPTEY